MSSSDFVKYDPVQKFIQELGQEIKKYFGQDKGCIIYLLPDGIYYAQGLQKWLKNKKKFTLTTMDDDGNGLEEEKVRGRKVLIIDNDIVSGKGYKRAMEAMRLRKERLKIKDVKFAVFTDRIGLADFSVEGYSAFAPWDLKDLDALDLKIIKMLFEDGRKPFVELAKKTGLSPVAIKNRVERLIAQGLLKIQGLLNMEKLYSVSCHILIDADKKAIFELIKKFEKSPLVYHLAKASGRFNLVMSMVAPSLLSIDDFIVKEIKSEPGVKDIDVKIGELPMIPRAWNPPIS